MSLHASLKIGGKIKKIRNVMKRFERIDVLLNEKRIAEELVFALP
jgi:small basic protein (TIGR04137 family)